MFSPVSNCFVASTPAFIAVSSITSVPGKPTRAARRANSGHGTLSEIKVLLSERYILSPELKPRVRASLARDAVKAKLSSALRLVKSKLMLLSIIHGQAISHFNL
jgi:hypothetical protein